MTAHRKNTSGPIFVLFTGLTILLFGACGAREPAGFSVSFDPSVSPEPLSGRVILMVSSTREFSTGENGTPFFGVTVNDLKPNQRVLIDAKALGYPLRSIQDLPPGEYYVQAFLNVYTTSDRSSPEKSTSSADAWTTSI
ncbi:MAG: hypothetical protein FJW35_19060 [Acidobacteria bacterium]|nr:hypothetical protein [Acidobacteriota bacterium]